MVEPGVVGDWSVRDILGHVTTWEEEALKSLPLILEGRKPPKYSVLYGGIDAFNAQESERKRGLPLVEVLSQLETTHGRLCFVRRGRAGKQFAGESPFRHRLRLDTYSHYPLHARHDTGMEGEGGWAIESAAGSGLGFCSLLVLVAGINAVAFMQTWTMTHYAAAGTRTLRPEELSLLDKIGVVLTGVTVPRPSNTALLRILGCPMCLSA